MKYVIGKCFLLLLVLFICDCKKNSNNALVIKDKDTTNVFFNKLQLQYVIDSLAVEFEEDSICFVIGFNNKNDSNFIFIACDILPPVTPPVTASIRTFKGYYRYKNNFMFIYNNLHNDNLMDVFIDKTKLDTTASRINDLKLLLKREYIYDGCYWLYYIHEKNIVHFIKKTCG